MWPSLNTRIGEIVSFPGCPMVFYDCPVHNRHWAVSVHNRGVRDISNSHISVIFVSVKVVLVDYHGVSVMPVIFYITM